MNALDSGCASISFLIIHHGLTRPWLLSTGSIQEQLPLSVWSPNMSVSIASSPSSVSWYRPRSRSREWSWSSCELPFLVLCGPLFGLVELHSEWDYIHSAASETESPRRNIAKAVRRVFYRIIIFYVRPASTPVSPRTQKFLTDFRNSHHWHACCLQ